MMIISVMDFMMMMWKLWLMMMVRLVFCVWWLLGCSLMRVWCMM